MLAILALLLFPMTVNAATYYIAPGGSNSNPGTQAQPFATIQKGHDVANPGDTILMRGGTYTFAGGQVLTRDGTSGNRINLHNFPGESPVVNAINQTNIGTCGGVRCAVISMNDADWWHIKGLDLANGPIDGIFADNGSSNNIFELLKIHGMGRLVTGGGQGTGIFLYRNCANNLILNNDVYENEDGSGGGANGINLHTMGAGNAVRGNRAWCNSDDGFDMWISAPVTIDNNWSWVSGRGHGCVLTAGDGNGFKLGGNSTNDGGHTVRNNVAWDNKQDGMHENGGERPMFLYNNTVFRNGRNSFGFSVAATQFRNNISYDTLGPVAGSQPFNSWTLPVTVTDADFLTVNDSCVFNPRQADGSLPICNFLRLAPSSDLINKGTNVGLPFTGSAPDLGAFETGVAAPVDTTPPTVAIIAPANSATVSGTAVTFSATASDGTGISGVQFKVDGNNLGAEDTTPSPSPQPPYSVVWNTTLFSNASHSISATARDPAGNTATATRTVIVNNGDTTAPTVAITAPAAGATVSGTAVTFSATASDNIAVAGVQFKVDGNNLGAEDTVSPYSIAWNTTSFSNASHSITATARDAAGNIANSTRSVTVSNPQDLFVETEIASGLTAPTAMAFSPDGRLFVAQQGGQLRVIENNALLPTPVLTLSPATGGERGLIGIAIDPSFASNGHLYLYYTAATPAVHNRVSRFTVVGDVASPASEVIIKDLENLGAPLNHNGGGLLFGNDGKLYVAQGDNATSSNAQTLNNRLGKILRLNSDGTIPTDNPFFSTATGENRSIWVLGLRNPFTIAKDSLTGAININDVGENTWEEINRGVAGSNYGWPTCEGPQNTGVGTCTSPSFRYPIAAYNHTVGSAVTGGVFYRETQFPSLYQGVYFFGDYTSDFIKYLDAGNAINDFRAAQSPVDIDAGPDGSLYYASINLGKIFRISWTGTPPTDTTPPVVSITAPAPGATVSGTAVTFSATASDNVGVSGVQFKVDGNNLGAEDTVSPYSVVWNTTSFSNGSRSLTVTARDQAGNTATSAPRTAVVDNAPPEPLFVCPPTQTTLAIGIATSDGGFAYEVVGSFGLPDNVPNPTRSTVRLFEGPLELGPAHAPHADIRNIGLGRFSHWSNPDESIQSIRFSALNNSDPRTNGKTYCVELTAAPDPVSVSVTSPVNGATVTGVAVTVSATASDNVDAVQFKLDGNNLGLEDTTRPFSVVWNSAQVADGPHQIGAIAREVGGSSAAATLNAVTVNNADICP